jgi:hypothetical protein
MPPQPVAMATGQPIDGNTELTYDSAVASYGYLFMTVSAKQLKTEFWQLGSQHSNAFDTVTVDLDTHIVS